MLLACLMLMRTGLALRRRLHVVCFGVSFHGTFSSIMHLSRRCSRMRMATAALDQRFVAFFVQVRQFLEQRD